jgi:DHA1 family inner membrane transport protein
MTFPTSERPYVMDADVPAVSALAPDIDDVVAAQIALVPTGAFGLRVLVALGFGTFVTALLFIVPTPFFPLMARDLQVSVPFLGQVMTAMLLLSALFSLVVGPLADRSGHRLLILIGLVAAAVCLLVFGLAPVFPLLLIASVAGAVATAAVLGPSLAIASTAFDSTSARRAVSWTSAAQAGSAIVGVPVLTAIGAAAGWRVAFAVPGLVAVAVVALALLWLPHDGQRAADPLRLSAILAPYPPLLRNGTMRRLYGATTLGAVCWFGLLTYLGAFLVEALGMSPGQVGLVYMGGGTGYFLGSLAVGGPLARVPARTLVVGGYIATAFLMALAFSARLGTTGSAVLIAGAALAMGLEVVGMIALLTAETPSGAATTLTLNAAVFNLGAAGGGAIGGVLIALSGYDALAVGLPLFAVAAALLSWQPASPPSAAAPEAA